MEGCEETRRYVDAYVDGELDPGAALIVETHLVRCASCREEAAAIRTIKSALAASRERHAAPDALRLRLLAALDAEDQQKLDVELRNRRRKHAMGFVLAAAAMTTVAFATGWRGSINGTGPVAGASMIPPLLDDIVQRHARNLPAEVQGSEPAQVVNFFRGRLDIPVRPVQFRGVPARLVGGRISNVSDRMAAALYYDVGGRRVTVFVFDSSILPRAFDTDGLQPVRVNNQLAYVGHARGYTVVLSERAGVAYAVASDLPPSDTLGIISNADIQ